MIRFSKMHGLGNDFVVIDAISQSIRLTPEQIRFLADRHLGVGCDQVLLVEAAERPDCDFRYRIFNSDGGEVGQCGNGARCFARFARDQGLTTRDEITACTANGMIRMRLENGNLVTVEMGVPQFRPEAIPFLADAVAPSYPLEIDGDSVDIGVVSMGNPHAVLVVADVTQAPVARVGARLGRDRRFPQGVNVGFMEIQDPSRIRLRVFERGAGETLACGSGACAAVAIGRRRGLLNERVAVELPGGTLLVYWPGGDESVSMTGPATYVFEGKIQL